MPPQIMLDHVIRLTLAFLLLLLSKLTHANFSSPVTTFPIAKPGCKDTCGDVKIPYPFGIGEGCYLDDGFGTFGITCDSSYNPPKAFSMRTDITEISLEGQLHVLKSIARECYEPLEEQVINKSCASYSLPVFGINSTKNKLIAVGCDTLAYAEGIRYRGQTSRKYKISCISMCNSSNEVINGSCSGSGC